MRIPFTMQSQSGFKMHMLTSLPNRRRKSELTHKKTAKSHANNVLERPERLLTKPPNTRALVIKDTGRRNIKSPSQKLEVFEEKSNRAKATQFRAMSEELTHTRIAALHKISFPIRKGSTSSRKGVVQQMTLEDKREGSNSRRKRLAKSGRENLSIKLINLLASHANDRSTIREFLLDNRSHNIPSGSNRKSPRSRAHFVKDKNTILNDRLKERGPRDLRQREWDPKIDRINLKRNRSAIRPTRKSADRNQSRQS